MLYQQELKEKASAQAWLEYLDNADYESCWLLAAEYFKHAVSLEDWQGKAKNAREGAGKIQSRELVRSNFSENVGGTAGKYLIYEYKCIFSTVGNIGERLTLRLEDDEQWRVVGYYLI